MILASLTLTFAAACPPGFGSCPSSFKLSNDEEHEQGLGSLGTSAAKNQKLSFRPNWMLRAGPAVEIFPKAPFEGAPAAVRVPKLTSGALKFARLKALNMSI